MPRTATLRMKIEEFYDDITYALNDKTTHFSIINGDFNARLRRKTDIFETALTNFGMEDRNERSTILLSYLLENNLFQMNSFFCKKNTENGPLSIF